MRPQNNTRFLIVILSLIVVGIIGVSAFTGYSHSKMGRITTDIEPYDAVVKLDGKTISANKTMYVSVGIHQLTAERNGFTAGNIALTSMPGKSQTMSLYLNASNSVGTQWLRDHPQDALKYEGRSGALYDTQVQKIAQVNPLIKVLPYLAPGMEFRIDYGIDPTNANKIVIYIQAGNEQAKSDSLTWLTSRGYQPAKLNIVFVAPQSQPGTE